MQLFDPAVRASVETRLRALTTDSPRRWGKMTPHQAICHLSDGFRCALGERTATASRLRFAPVVKFIAFRTPLPWPKDVATMPEVDQGRGGTPPVEFERDKAELLILIDRFCAGKGRPDWPEHPMFGHMSRDGWGRWAYRHSDHHLRQFGH